MSGILADVGRGCNRYMGVPVTVSRSLTEFIPSTEPRNLNLGVIAIVGALLSACAYFVAVPLVPSNVASAGEHDLRLANHLGFLFPPLVGLWAAWVRRSIPWAVFGVISGLLIGAMYYALCGYNFLAVMVAFPCLLGGVTSVLMGTQAGSWTAGVPQLLRASWPDSFLVSFIWSC